MDDTVESRDGGAPCQHWRLLVENRVEDFDGRVGREGRVAGQHLVEDGAEREQVRSRVDVPALQLFRSGVLRCADDRAWQREPHARFVSRAPRRRRGRQPEVEQLHPVGRQENIGRLEIPMDEPVPVQRFDPVEDAKCGADGFTERHRPARQPRRQGLTLQQLHGEKQIAIVLTNLVKLADRGVIDAGRRARLAIEALAPGRVLGRGLEHLDRDRPAKSLIVSGVDHAHPALAEGSGHGVASDGGPHDDIL